ncbi:acyl-homoserine-lactone acylase [Amycolatopsis arida]|uniref:Acyl-homoserine-lactone acylase n=1 Tax=Amycolatopsis arida TaxID=587909 RepID=A0A1I5URN4_9PSEU|nr:penicillin acylase family protein [Amycolatopsis arida]TDX91003.1 acyl-homoserine-lactone acylase [Amycolatopsis arida]SFP97697.1 acyl-homoserine-lactone acylase [Amycolatopsis arida]
MAGRGARKPGSRGWRRAGAVAAAALVTVGLVAAPAVAAPASGQAIIRYTEHGVPHILAGDVAGAGYGYGYAAAKDNLCALADIYLTVGAERSRHLGPDGAGNDGLGSARGNLTSDLHFQRIIDSGVVERLAALPAPAGPRREVREIVAGYVRGYNRHLAETPPESVTDPACRGAAWLRPITELDVYRHFYALATITGQGLLAEGIANAAPPTDTAAAATASRGTVPPPDVAGRLATGLAEALGSDELGSNGIAIGADGTAAGRSVLLGNPHYPWQGSRRFWQFQLTVPGRLNASGGGLLGIPLVQIGFTRDAAWTHTVSTARTFGLYELALVPGDPTSYLVGGKAERMVPRTVRVAVRQPDGSLGEVSRTLYETRYGPMVTAGPGIPLPWTERSGYAVRDANATNLRGLNTWFELNQARSTRQIVRTLAGTQGVPWVNTIATDRAGNALFADVQVVPHVTDELAERCGTPLGRQVFPATGVSILDGSDATCGWGSDPDAVEPGLLGAGRLPVLHRRDYALNANDSPWFTNPRAPITGYPRVLGDVGTERSGRTREAIVSVEEALAGGGVTPESMRRLLFGDRSRLAVLAAADTARMCAAFPEGRAPSGTGPVDVRSACPALAAWDHTYGVDSRGSLLFDRFAREVAAIPGVWRTPFDPADPVGTPNTLDIDRPEVWRAFGDAAAELRAAGIPLDGRLGDHQYVVRGGERIPVHGGHQVLGVLNMLVPVWDPARGYTEVVHGSSHIQVVGFGRGPCPDAATLLTYSQSADPTSPHHADQTRLFSRGEWVRARFCERDILTSPALRVVHLR